ncbi:hypothetical protein C942_01569 [Photobacterium marinum]|uniref:DUF4442 domain-containing protein n=1 Tax=Photobacterium marinum TaxID=1056511 RepID=L8JJI1_9GAMM|nr:DUF4442 domain-containing protein [Photobacterium marinum]ELR67639.1 hypothetical protein C942_01569 [Photobacterium marinum]
MDSRVAQANKLLKRFAQEKVKLIDYCEPEIVEISDEHLSLKIPLNDKTKNHLESMYFGALAIGADVAAGLLAMEMAGHSGMDVSLAFKSVQGEFFRRPEADVVFSCYQGSMIREMLDRSCMTGERINEPVSITVTCPDKDGNEPVASFSLTLSLKVASPVAQQQTGS